MPSSRHSRSLQAPGSSKNSIRLPIIALVFFCVVIYVAKTSTDGGYKDESTTYEEEGYPQSQEDGPEFRSNLLSFPGSDSSIETGWWQDIPEISTAILLQKGIWMAMSIAGRAFFTANKIWKVFV